MVVLKQPAHNEPIHVQPSRAPPDPLLGVRLERRLISRYRRQGDWRSEAMRVFKIANYRVHLCPCQPVDDQWQQRGDSTYTKRALFLAMQGEEGPRLRI